MIFSPDERLLLKKLRAQKPARNPPTTKLSLGDQVSDRVAMVVGSWNFILIQSFLLLMWLILNLTAWIAHWDPYPFILLNLVLSFQAAFTAPIIMMSQNRQSSIDRQNAEHDYQVNIKAELEIELLHEKVTALQETEIATLLQLVKDQQERLARMEDYLMKIGNSS
jgi:uncharacterized membrane protein